MLVSRVELGWSVKSEVALFEKRFVLGLVRIIGGHVYIL